MKLPTTTFGRAIGAAALTAVLATAASAQTHSRPTPPAPQAESPAAPGAGSPMAPQSKPASQLSPARLGQMLAPIALYPDDLLADILVAATYPLDVVEAARWVRDPPNVALKGDGLFAALQQKPWDPSVKSLTPFPQILRMLDANLEWTEQLGEAYLADPGAVMDAVQGLRRKAQSAGRLVATPQGTVSAEQQPTPIGEPITIEAPNPETAYVPICDPSFAYGPWPYAAYPPFFPVFAGATIGGCGWITGPIIAPFWGLVILNFRTRHIDVDRKRLALFDRDRDREKSLDRARLEEWRHDPGHRGNVPYRNPAVGAQFQDGTPAATVTPRSREHWTGLPPVAAPRAVTLPQAWRGPWMEGARPPLDGGRRWPEEIGVPREEGRSSTARAQPALEGVDPTWDRARVGQPRDPDAERRIPPAAPLPQKGQGPGMENARPAFESDRNWPDGIRAPPDGNRLSTSRVQPRYGGAQPPLEGVDPTWDRAPIGQSLDPDAERRALIERWSFGRVPSTALAPPVGGWRASRPFGGTGSTHSPGDKRFFLGDRRFFRPLVGVGAQPLSARGTSAIGVQPFNSQGPQTPAGGMGASGGRGSR